MRGLWRGGAALLPLVIGCSGGAPLMHPAHVMSPGRVSMGAGFSARLALAQPKSDNEAAVDLRQPDAVAAAIEDVSVAPGVAPWVGARIGIEGDNEAGLTYTARAVRLDGRHAFQFGPLFLSTGIGGSVLIPRPRGDDGEDNGSVNGGGADIPILFGVVSSSDLYALWIGPRGGFELLSGNLSVAGDPTLAAVGDDLAELDGQHLYVGGLAGLRVGFRHLHAVLEVSADYHHAEGDLTAASGGAVSGVVDQAALTPAAALVASF